MNIDDATKQLILSSLQNGETIYMPTDTIPGLVARAAHAPSVNAIYELKQRPNEKPPTIIIANLQQLADLQIEMNNAQAIAASGYWPGPVSIVLPVMKNDQLGHLHRGLESLAVRHTANPVLASIIETTGPLATSSANLSGQEPARSTQQARDYFGDGINTYIEHDPITDQPSRIIKLDTNGTETILR